MTEPTTMTPAGAEDREPVYYCESCDRPIYEGDNASVGGPDSVALCEEHSMTLSDSISWLAEDLADAETEQEWPYNFDTREEAEAHLTSWRADLAANGDRKMTWRV